MPPRNIDRAKINRQFKGVVEKIRKAEKMYQDRGDLVLQAVANEGANYAGDTGNYDDQTGNLRNSRFSNINHLKTDFDSLPEIGGEKKIMPTDLIPTRPVIEKVKNEHTAVIGVGMSYGVHVQNRQGYDVLGSARNWVKRNFGKKFRVKLEGAASKAGK